jgi:hypothetical protein
VSVTASQDTPSARLIAAAQETSEIRDAQGRRLLIRRMGALDRLRLFKAAGPQLAANASWMGMAAVACSVQAIDDVPVPRPATEPQVEALVSRLGDVGIAAVAAALAAPAVARDQAKN